MASRNFDATTNPRSLEAALGLSVGSQCYLQNLSPTAPIFVRQSAVATPGMRGHWVPAGEGIVIRIESNVSTWIWTDDPDGAECIATDSL